MSLLGVCQTADKEQLFKGITVMLWMMGGAMPLVAAWRLAHVFIAPSDSVQVYIAGKKGIWNRFFRRILPLILLVAMEFAILAIAQERLRVWLGCS